MIDLWFEVHAQTYHNVADLASGHYDVALTEQGREQAQSVMRARYADQHFDVVFTSDTQRAYDTACLIFAGRPIPILHDTRLRECDYGDFEGRPRAEMERARLSAISTPFPHGESYAQVATRMRSFLVQLTAERDGQQVLLVGHGATLWMLEHWLRGKPLAAVVGTFPERPWQFALAPQQWHKGGS
jgi:2,3-bisphosphoglycerate-dependent phosphoglycerate mutase